MFLSCLAFDGFPLTYTSYLLTAVIRPKSGRGMLGQENGNRILMCSAAIKFCFP